VNARLGEENERLRNETERLGSETIRMFYHQAADWVRTVNTVTWSLGSIYLVAAILALNGAVQQTNQVWRTWIGLGIIALVGIWLVIDGAYLRSARSAREYLKNIERQWPNHEGFYSNQAPNINTIRLVSALLYISALILALLALLVAFPKLAELIGIASLQTEGSPPKP
jgi:hypothetical protein